MGYNSVGALAHAFLEELERAKSNDMHGAIQLSYTTMAMSNGVKKCSAQIQCRADCGWRIECYGNEVDIFERKVQFIQNLLKHRTHEPLRSREEMLGLLFPELGIKELGLEKFISR